MYFEPSLLRNSRLNASDPARSAGALDASYEPREHSEEGSWCILAINQVPRRGGRIEDLYRMLYRGSS